MSSLILSDFFAISSPIVLFAASVATLLYYWPWPKTPFLNRQEQDVQIIDITPLSHDTKRFRLCFGAKGSVLGLPVGKNIVITAPNPSSCLASGKWNREDDSDRGHKRIARNYSPETAGEAAGYFDLVVKIYKPGKAKMADGTEVTWDDGGKMGLYLDSKRPGDTISITGPVGCNEYLGRGMFLLPGRTLTVKHVGMIAGGTGITPMLQIIRAAVLNKKDHCRFTLIYANKTEDDILLRDELENLVEDGKGQLDIVYTLNFPPQKWKHESGMVSVGMIKQKFPPPRSTSLEPLVLMCGPAAMTSACGKHLEYLGYQRQAVVIW